MIKAAFLSLLFAMSTQAFAQGRVSDSDLQHMMKNLRDDVKSFQTPFQSALKKSTLRKTSAEKNAKALAATFERQTTSALEEFHHGHQAGPQNAAMIATARRLDPIVTGLQPASGITAPWGKITQELEQIAHALGEPAVFQATTSSPSTESGTACRVAVGKERSTRLVSECLKVSPATHPPCNDQNSCVMIIDEIKRGCGMLGQDAPQFCLEYKN